eukprot:2149831-Amphidinium_carterae.1
MDQSAKSIEAIDLRNNQEAYVTEDVQYRDNNFHPALGLPRTKTVSSKSKIVVYLFGVSFWSWCELCGWATSVRK